MVIMLICMTCVYNLECPCPCYKLFTIVANKNKVDYCGAGRAEHPAEFVLLCTCLSEFVHNQRINGRDFPKFAGFFGDTLLQGVPKNVSKK